jgi:hypothetical protein
VKKKPIEMTIAGKGTLTPAMSHVVFAISPVSPLNLAASKIVVDSSSYQYGNKNDTHEARS